MIAVSPPFALPAHCLLNNNGVGISIEDLLPQEELPCEARKSAGNPSVDQAARITLSIECILSADIPTSSTRQHQTFYRVTQILYKKPRMLSGGNSRTLSDHYNESAG